LHICQGLDTAVTVLDVVSLFTLALFHLVYFFGHQLSWRMTHYHSEEIFAVFSRMTLWPWLLLILRWRLLWLRPLLISIHIHQWQSNIKCRHHNAHLLLLPENCFHVVSVES